MWEQDPEFDHLIQVCRESPDDDAPRLILSDWLEEVGEWHWAEFIRLSILAAHDATIHQQTVDDYIQLYWQEWQGDFALLTARIQLQEKKQFNNWMYNTYGRYRNERPRKFELSLEDFSKRFAQHHWTYERGLLVIDMPESVFNKPEIQTWLQTRFARRVLRLTVTSRTETYCGLERAGILQGRFTG